MHWLEKLIKSACNCLPSFSQALQLEIHTSKEFTSSNQHQTAVLSFWVLLRGVQYFVICSSSVCFLWQNSSRTFPVLWVYEIQTLSREFESGPVSLSYTVQLTGVAQTRGHNYNLGETMFCIPGCRTSKIGCNERLGGWKFPSSLQKALFSHPRGQNQPQFTALWRLRGYLLFNSIHT